MFVNMAPYGVLEVNEQNQLVDFKENPFHDLKLAGIYMLQRNIEFFHITKVMDSTN